MTFLLFLYWSVCSRFGKSIDLIVKSIIEKVKLLPPKLSDVWNVTRDLINFWQRTFALKSWALLLQTWQWDFLLFALEFLAGPRRKQKSRRSRLSPDVILSNMYEWYLFTQWSHFSYFIILGLGIACAFFAQVKLRFSSQLLLPAKSRMIEQFYEFKIKVFEWFWFESIY